MKNQEYIQMSIGNTEDEEKKILIENERKSDAKILFDGLEQIMASKTTFNLRHSCTQSTKQKKNGGIKSKKKEEQK